MNEFEQKLNEMLNSLHEFKVQVTKELGEIHGDLKSLRSVLDQNISADTKRLNKHSGMLDDYGERLAKIEGWKDQFQKQVANRIAVSQSIAVIAAVVIAFLLRKLL